MDPRLKPLAVVLELNTRLLHNCLQGVDEEMGLARTGERTNHMTFLGAHLVGSRAYLAGMLGQDSTDPFQEQLGAVSSIDEAESFPTLDEVRAAWDEVSARVMAGLDAVTGEELDSEEGHAFPVDDPTLLGRLAFLVQHDSYHIGQLAFLRKHHGLDAMSYE